VDDPSSSKGWVFFRSCVRYRWVVEKWWDGRVELMSELGDPADDLIVATIIFLVDGKLVLLRPRRVSPSVLHAVVSC